MHLKWNQIRFVPGREVQSGKFKIQRIVGLVSAAFCPEPDPRIGRLGNTRTKRELFAQLGYQALIIIRIITNEWPVTIFRKGDCIVFTCKIAIVVELRS